MSIHVQNMIIYFRWIERAMITTRMIVIVIVVKTRSSRELVVTGLMIY